MLNSVSKRTKVVLTTLLLSILFVDFYFDRHPLWKAQVVRVVLIGIELPRGER